MWAFFTLTPINIYMLETLEKISRTVSDFGTHNQFESWLLEVGRKAGSNLGPINTRNICNDNNYVSGCTSNVWITGKQNKDTWKFSFYSNTLFTNGIVHVLCETCNGMTTDQVNQVKFSNFDPIAGHITLNKKKGLQAMINHIKNIVNA
jgi:sulfur transfer protein SufE